MHILHTALYKGADKENLLKKIKSLLTKGGDCLLYSHDLDV